MTNVETIPNGAKKSTKQEDEAFRRKLLQVVRDADALASTLVQLLYEPDEPEGEESVVNQPTTSQQAA
jgi:hypothetical protein